MNAFYNNDVRDYWFASGTPSYLIRLMNHFHEGIDELTNKFYLPDEFINYKADVEYPLPMIYQSGYLTIKDYDKESNLFLLDFPNNEVKSGFLAMIDTKGYARPYEADARQVYKIGVNFSSETGTIEEWESK